MKPWARYLTETAGLETLPFRGPGSPHRNRCKAPAVGSPRIQESIATIRLIAFCSVDLVIIGDVENSKRVTEDSREGDQNRGAAHPCMSWCNLEADDYYQSCRI